MGARIRDVSLRREDAEQPQPAEIVLEWSDKRYHTATVEFPFDCDSVIFALQSLMEMLHDDEHLRQLEADHAI